MQSVRIVLGTVAATIVLSGAIWFGRYSPAAKQEARENETVLVRNLRTLNEMQDLRAGRVPTDSVGLASDPSIDPRPPIAEQAPFPKTVIEEQAYRFGTMEVGEERKHAFRIENRGEGPLQIGRGPTQCKCTISKLSTGSIPPGGFAEVELRWKPLDFEQKFHKTAMIWTNDPEVPEIDFEIVGQVVPKVELKPLTWNAGEVTEEHDATVVGKIGSPLDSKFKIRGIETFAPNLKITFKPLEKSELNREGWSAGYQCQATVRKGIPWGRFRSNARILTTSDVDLAVNVEITAVRTGEVRFLPPIAVVGSGTWSETKLLLNLGTFVHEQGSKVVLPALVSPMKGPLQIVSVESNVDFLKISLEPDPKLGTSNRQGVRFVVAVPPGSPPLSRPTSVPVHVTLKTNHPALLQIGFDIAFISQ